MIDTLGSDIRYGVRRLLKSPGFSCVAIVILGLGIGANAAIFSVVNAVVLRPLPYPDSSRVVRIWHTPPPAHPGTCCGQVQFPRQGYSPPQIELVRKLDLATGSARKKGVLQYSSDDRKKGFVGV